MKTCRSCAYWDAPTDGDGNIIITSDDKLKAECAELCDSALTTVDVRVWDDSGLRVTMMTRATFSCALHTTREV